MEKTISYHYYPGLSWNCEFSFEFTKKIKSWSQFYSFWGWGGGGADYSKKGDEKSQAFDVWCNIIQNWIYMFTFSKKNTSIFWPPADISLALARPSGGQNLNQRPVKRDATSDDTDINLEGMENDKGIRTLQDESSVAAALTLSQLSRLSKYEFFSNVFTLERSSTVANDREFF